MIAAIVVLAALAAGFVGFVLGHIFGYSRAVGDLAGDVAALSKRVEVCEKHRRWHADAADSNACHDARCRAAGKHACHNLDCKQH